MAVINAANPTLVDVIKRMDPNGAIAPVVELLSKRSALLQDMTFQEGNLPTGHRITSRTALPSIGWRRLNEGVTPGKSRTDQIDESCGLLEGMSVIDTEVARLNGNAPAFRASEDTAFLQAFKNELETGLFYHSTKSTPEKFEGLAARYALSSAALSGKQIVLGDASASGNDSTSVWGIVWAPKSVYGIFPKGLPGGLESKDLGEQIWDDGTGKKFTAFVQSWKWRVGVAVEDYRQVTRVANIDTSAILGTAATGTDLITSMVKAYHKLYDPEMGRLVWYCNRTVATYLHLQALNKVASSTLSIENIGGKPLTTFLGAPIRVTDGITDAEAPIS